MGSKRGTGHTAIRFPRRIALFSVLLSVLFYGTANADPNNFIKDLKDPQAASAIVQNDRYLYDMIQKKRIFANPNGIRLYPLTQSPVCEQGVIYMDEARDQVLLCNRGLAFVALSTAPAAGGIGVHDHAGAVGSGGQLNADSIFSAGTTGLAYGGTNADLSATGGATHFLRQASAGANVTVGAIGAGDVPDAALTSNVALLDRANQTFSGVETFSSSATFSNSLQVGTGRLLLSSDGTTIGPVSATTALALTVQSGGGSALTLKSNNGGGSSSGGSVSLTAASAAGFPGVGGAITVTGGNGSSEGSGGGVTVTAGNGGSVSGAGGSLKLRSGGGISPGNVEIGTTTTSGVSSIFISGTNGYVGVGHQSPGSGLDLNWDITARSSATFMNTVVFGTSAISISAAGTTIGPPDDGTSTPLTIQSGGSSALTLKANRPGGFGGGAGGSVAITAGAGTPSIGAGGAITITAGSGTGTPAAGGSVSLVAGGASATNTAGSISLRTVPAGGSGGTITLTTTTTSNVFSVRVQADGKVAIATTSATDLLSVQGDIAAMTYRSSGTTGIALACSGNQLALNPVFSGGIFTSGTCTSAGSAGLGDAILAATQTFTGINTFSNVSGGVLADKAFFGTIGAYGTANGVTHSSATTHIASVTINYSNLDNFGLTVTSGANINGKALMMKGMTVQTFTSGTAATYTTPTKPTPLWLKVRMVAGGGGGEGVSNGVGYLTGGTGGTTSFNSITVIGGQGGQNPAGGTGGTGGTGTATIRIPGGQGTAMGASTSYNVPGGAGANSVFGGGGGGGPPGGNGYDGGTNTGGGGGGCGGNTAWSSVPGSSGGGGEYAEVIIVGPTTSYTYTVGAGGTKGDGASADGGTGGVGRIIVEEYYQ